MDIIVVFNGLGNQMSQYALYLNKKRHAPETRFINLCKEHQGFELETIFGITYKKSFHEKLLKILFKISITEKFNIAFKPIQMIFRFFKVKIIHENYNYNFNKALLQEHPGITFYFGGWHSEKYFESIRKQLLQEFTFKIPSDKDNIELAQMILNSNSVSLHVRRGDYLEGNNINLFGDVATKDYFIKAISTILSTTTNPHFFIFSNDMVWVKDNLNLPNATYVTCNEKKNSWKDMYLMTLCKHNIISNSSFSWWGAWLNRNEGKIVISPSRFLKNDTFTDVYPDSWIKIAK